MVFGVGIILGYDLFVYSHNNKIQLEDSASLKENDGRLTEFLCMVKIVNQKGLYSWILVDNKLKKKKKINKISSLFIQSDLDD